MSTQLDRLMPTYDHRERHTRYCSAPVTAVWDALHELTMDELLMAKVLIGVRGALGGGRSPEVPDPQPLAMEAFAPRVCLQDRPREVVLCDIATYTSPTPRRPDDVSRGDLLAFVTFTEPGWSKSLMSFRLEPAPGGTTITTETRIRSTDRRTRLAFRFYWLAIRLGSGLVRRDILNAACRRAELLSAEPSMD